jgi:hypothetical protein
MHISYTIIFKIPTGIHNSLNPRLELLVGMNDKLLVLVGHYLQDLGPEGGQGVMRLFIDLSLKFTPHRRIKRNTICMVSWEARFSSTNGFFQVGLQPGWMILAVWARKAFSTLSKNLVLCQPIFLAKDGLFTLHNTIDGQLSNECRKQFLL